MVDRDIIKLVGVKGTSDPWVFESVSLPGRAGNLVPLAYGGCTSSVAVISAGHTVDQKKYNYVPYSVTGYFLGPASLESKYECYVTPLRDTRSFATRHVVVKQRTKKGLRSCLALTVDFIASRTSTPEALEQCKSRGVDPAATRSLLHYQVNPKMNAGKPTELEHGRKLIAEKMKNNELGDDALAIHDEFLGLWYQYFDGRVPEESMMAQNMFGMYDKGTSQDHLPISERLTDDWFRVIQELPPTDGHEHLVVRDDLGIIPITSKMLHAALCVFALDGVLAFAPVSMNNRMMLEASNASSLDFAVRFHSDVVDMSKWHLREVRTMAGGWSRTFSEAMLWDEDGRLIASTTQQCVLHPAVTEDDTSAKL